MTHHKMRYSYVGVDSHKDRHTAVLIDCFFEKLGEVTFANLPSQFGAFLDGARRLQAPGTTLLFGMEDVSAYGRQLTVFLRGRGQKVKHVNAYLVAQERKGQNITQKTDSVDAECAARVLLHRFDGLPDAEPEDMYWTLRALVVRRDFIARGNAALKKHLHSLLSANFPRYDDFFYDLGCKSALAFFDAYPSPQALSGVTVEGLAALLSGSSNGSVGMKKAAAILGIVKESGHIPSESQQTRDMAVRSAVRQIRGNLREQGRMEDGLAECLAQFGCTLTSMGGIDVVCAAQMLSCIGDIRKFATPAKLARYSGIAPVSYSSGKKDVYFPNRRGNRELNSIFYRLAVRLVSTSSSAGGTVRAKNPILHEYYHRKLSEGKTKQQALKCVQRRLVNIVWGMLTNNEEYVNPPMIEVPKQPAQ